MGTRYILSGLVLLVIGGMAGFWAARYQPGLSLTAQQYKVPPGLTGEIPIAWSAYYLGAGPVDYGSFVYGDAGIRSLLSVPTDNRYTFSVGRDYISGSDWNATQIDVVTAVGSGLQQVVQELKKNPSLYEGTWSTEMVDGHQADVLTFPTENGQVVKSATGGQVYFIAWQDSEKGDRGLLIHKQALGDEQFEADFQHFLHTLKVDEVL